jgi:hypothetical protein
VYEPVSGRFLSPDPKGQAASMSLYDFCNGDPVNNWDPDGRCMEAAQGAVQYADTGAGPGRGTNISNNDPTTGGLNPSDPNNSPSTPTRSFSDRVAQFSRGVASTAFSVVLFAGTIAAEGGSGGAATPAAAYLGLSGVAALIYGEANITAAFADAKTAAQVEGLPSSPPEALGRAVDGEKGQAMAGLVEAWTGTPAAAEKGALEAVESVVEVASAVDSSLKVTTPEPNKPHPVK